ncbi:hypothetical protein ACJX0J_017701 [Zea mays]
MTNIISGKLHKYITLYPLMLFRANGSTLYNNYIYRYKQIIGFHFRTFLIIIFGFLDTIAPGLTSKSNITARAKIGGRGLIYNQIIYRVARIIIPIAAYIPIMLHKKLMGGGGATVFNELIVQIHVMYATLHPPFLHLMLWSATFRFFFLELLPHGTS